MASSILFRLHNDKGKQLCPVHFDGIALSFLSHYNSAHKTFSTLLILVPLSSYTIYFSVGAGMKLLDLKREIITIKAFNQKMDFELKVTDDNSGVDYVEDDCIVMNGTQVVVKRIPPVGLGLVARLSAASTDATSSSSTIPSGNQTSIDTANDASTQHKDNAASTEFVQANDDDNKMQDESNVEDDTIIEAAADMYVYLHYLTNSFHKDVHSTFIIVSLLLSFILLIYYFVLHRTESYSYGSSKSWNYNQSAAAVNYHCSLCGKVGHYPNKCPNFINQQGQLLDDAIPLHNNPTKKVALTVTSLDGIDIKNKTVIPNKDGTYDIIENSSEGLRRLAAIGDTIKATTALNMSEVPEYLKCVINGAILKDAVSLPCCNKCVNDDTIRLALLKNNLTCPLCHKENIGLDSLKVRQDIRNSVNEYIKSKSKKEGAPQGYATATPYGYGQYPISSNAQPYSSTHPPFIPPVPYPPPYMMGPSFHDANSWGSGLMPLPPGVAPPPRETFPPPPLSREEFEIEKKLQIEEKNNEERGRSRGGRGGGGRGYNAGPESREGDRGRRADGSRSKSRNRRDSRDRGRRGSSHRSRSNERRRDDSRDKDRRKSRSRSRDRNDGPARGGRRDDSRDRKPRADSRDRKPRADSRDRKPRADSRERKPRADSRDRKPRADSRDRKPRADSRDRKKRDDSRDRKKREDSRDRKKDSNRSEGNNKRSEGDSKADTKRANNDNNRRGDRRDGDSNKGDGKPRDNSDKEKKGPEKSSDDRKFKDVRELLNGGSSSRVVSMVSNDGDQSGNRKNKRTRKH